MQRRWWTLLVSFGLRTSTLPATCPSPFGARLLLSVRAESSRRRYRTID
jgi:hypothetical protein